MKLKNFAAGVVMAAASFGAFAGDQVINAIADGNSHNWDAVVGDGLLSGGLDKITFNLAPGLYDVAISVTGQKLTFTYDTNVNGVDADVSKVGKIFFVASELNSAGSPFVLNLYGAAASGASYTGTYSITAVPEPETYGMLLGGLALVGAVARRKAKKAA